MDKHYTPEDKRLRGELKNIARQMRHEPTPAEDMLWQRLRGGQLCGYRFHRQHPIDRFIVDFYCPAAALVIEVDGDIHQQQAAADEERERILASLGFRVLRYTNTQVLNQTETVLQQILEAISMNKQ